MNNNTDEAVQLPLSDLDTTEDAEITDELVLHIIEKDGIIKGERLA